MKREELRVRDPYILVKDGKYYLYKANFYNDDPIHEDSLSIVVHTSTDLENWSEAKTVYTLSTDTWKQTDLWAPEIHEYRGKFYAFISIKGKNGLRGTEISMSDTPDGIFEPITDEASTPIGQSCIDGTLYTENGKPYIVYSRDWPSNYVKEKQAYVGQIWAQELSIDLKKFIGSPFLLFSSDECFYSGQNPSLCEMDGEKRKRYGSDAPFIQRLSNGKLYLTWSPYPRNNYVVLGAVADSIKGNWKHINKPLFSKNGGHAMFFTALDGKRKMVIHCPEKVLEERALILDVQEKDGLLTLEENI